MNNMSNHHPSPPMTKMSQLNGEAHEALEDLRRDLQADPGDVDELIDILQGNILEYMDRAYRLGLRYATDIFLN